jgi:hypothetical protein
MLASLPSALIAKAPPGDFLNPNKINGPLEKYLVGMFDAEETLNIYFSKTKQPRARASLVMVCTQRNIEFLLEVVKYLGGYLSIQSRRWDFIMTQGRNIYSEYP